MSTADEQLETAQTHDDQNGNDEIIAIAQQLINDNQIEIPTAPPFPTLPVATAHFRSRPDKISSPPEIAAQAHDAQFSHASLSTSNSTPESLPPAPSLSYTRNSSLIGANSYKANDSIVKADKPTCGIHNREYSSMTKGDRVAHADACWNGRRSAERKEKGVYRAIQDDLEILILHRRNSASAPGQLNLAGLSCVQGTEGKGKADSPISMTSAASHIDISFEVQKARIRLVSRALLDKSRQPRARKRADSFKEKKEQGINRSGGVNGAGYKIANTRLRIGHVWVFDDDDGDMMEVTYVRYTYIARSNRVQFLRFVQNSFSVFIPRVNMDMSEGWKAQQVDMTKMKVCGGHEDTEDDDDLSDTDTRNVHEMGSLDLDGAVDEDFSTPENDVATDAATDAAGQEDNRRLIEGRNTATLPDVADADVECERGDLVGHSLEREVSTAAELSFNHPQASTNTIEQERDPGNLESSSSDAASIELEKAVPTVIAQDITEACNTTQIKPTPSSQPVPSTAPSRGVSSPYYFNLRHARRHVRFLSSPPADLNPRSRPTVPAFPPPGIPRPTTTQADLDAVLAGVAHLPGIITSKSSEMLHVSGVSFGGIHS